MTTAFANTSSSCSSQFDASIRRRAASSSSSLVRALHGFSSSALAAAVAATVAFGGSLTGRRGRNLRAQRTMASAGQTDSAAPAESVAIEALVKPMFGLAKGSTPIPSSMTSKELLSSSPSGAYTTMRTVRRDLIFELSFHMKRLAESTRLMMEEEGNGIHPSHICLVGADTLTPLVVDSVKAAIGQFEELNPDFDPKGELRPTVLITWDQDGSYDIISHVGPLPPRPSSPILVQVAGSPRENAAAKNSEWVRDRADLEKNAPPGCNEVLLMGQSGEVVEGLSSNFFVYQDSALYTAQEGILLGTVRDMVLKVAEREGIRVVLEPPNIADLKKWQGAFVTSTSRLMLMADEMVVEGRDDTKVFGKDVVLAKLEQLVLDEIAAFSEPY